jgi:hypothetical protein
MVGATTLRPVVLGYPPARRVRECALPQHRSDFGPRMLGRTRIGVACWLLRTRSAHASRLHAQVAREGPLPARPCRQSSYRSESLNASQLVRLPPSGSQLRRLLSLATGGKRRLTLRSRADPPRQGTLPGSRAAAILRLPGKAPCLYGPLSSNVRRRKPEVLHGRRNYAPACRSGLPTGQASSRARAAPVSIGLWSSDALKNQNATHVLASAHQVRVRWPGLRTGGTCRPLPPVCPYRKSRCRPRIPKALQPVRVLLCSSQPRRLLSLATGGKRRLTLRSRADPPRQGTLAARPSMFIIGRAAKAPCLCGPLSSNVRRRKPEVLHGRRNYAPACRPELPTGQASSRVRIAPASIGL